MRRHLGMSWEEWEALPWHVKRAYREGLEREIHGVQRIPTAEADAELEQFGVTFIHRRSED